MNTTRRHDTVAVDGSAASAAAVRWVAAEAARRHARLHAVHVVETGRREDTSPPAEHRPELQRARQSVPGRVGAWVYAEGVDVNVAVSVVTGHLARQLVREAGHATLVVIAAPDGTRHDALPDELAAQCPCPVVMVGEHGDVTPVNTSPESLSAEGASHACA